MPPFFKKRRRGNAGPNKNQKKVMRADSDAKKAGFLGLISERFPHVQTVNLQLDFMTPEQQLLDQESYSLEPTDPCDFTAVCPGRCGGVATFDFSAKVTSILQSRQPVGEASGTCQQPLYAGSPDACGLRLRCKIEAEYLPE